MSARIVRLAVCLSTALVFAAAGWCEAAAGPALVVSDVRCEYLANPLGIDVARPRLSWKLRATDAAIRGQKQTAYQILVASSRGILDQDRGDLWDSGRIYSDQTVNVEYIGRVLQSRMSCYWKVRAWDKDGQATAWSEPAMWSMGLLDARDWHAKWIGAAPEAPATAPAKAGPAPDQWVRKTFNVPAKPVQAMAYVGSLGYHELYINGKKVGEQVLAPAVSDMGKRVRYLTYDVTGYLQPGRNAVALWISPGWAAHDSFHQADRPLVIAQVEIAQPAGQALSVATDGTWKTHASPSTRLGQGSGAFGGERIDARQEVPGWNTAQLDDAAWRTARIYQPKVKLSAEMIEPNRKVLAIAPQAIEEKGKGTYRVDMGRSFTGWIEARLQGEAGKTVRIRTSERENDVTSYGQTSEYTFDGTGEGVFSHRFNYTAGRWITFEGLSAKPALTDIKGYLVRSDYKRVGQFECSNALLNRIYETTLWTYECLSLGGYVVDCPHRERMGYGGDCHATMETALRNYATGAFYTKWTMDWRDVQKSDGDLPYTAPTYHGGGGPSWSGICVTLPWAVYQTFGDKRILEETYPTMQRWIAFLDSKAQDHVLQKWGGVWDFLGDWVPPGKDQGSNRVDEPSTLFFNNCYYLYNVQMVASIADVIGKPADAAKYRKNADAIRTAVQQKFYNAQTNSYANGTQLYQAMPLLIGLTPEALRPAVVTSLENEFRRTKGHVDTGIHGTYFLLKALMSLDRNDLIFGMVEQKSYPSWGYMLDQGATTIWEQWDGKESRLHSSFLSIGSWFIEGLAGIQLDPQHPGYKHFVVRPAIVGDLKWAKGSYDSINGLIESGWKIEKGQITLDVTVPPNTTATIYVPARDPAKVTEGGKPAGMAAEVKQIGTGAREAVFQVGAGRYSFAAPWN